MKFSFMEEAASIIVQFFTIPDNGSEETPN